jgi:hypothetical protein
MAPVLLIPPLLLLIPPEILAPLVTVKPAKVGLEVVAMACGVDRVIVPELLATLISLVVPWIVTAPVKVLTLVTPPLLPVPFKQVAKLSTPEPLVSRHCPLVPVLLGRVKIGVPAVVLARMVAVAVPLPKVKPPVP